MVLGRLGEGWGKRTMTNTTEAATFARFLRMFLFFFPYSFSVCVCVFIHSRGFRFFPFLRFHATTWGIRRSQSWYFPQKFSVPNEKHANCSLIRYIFTYICYVLCVGVGELFRLQWKSVCLYFFKDFYVPVCVCFWWIILTKPQFNYMVKLI